MKNFYKLEVIRMYSLVGKWMSFSREIRFLQRSDDLTIANHKLIRGYINNNSSSFFVWNAHNIMMTMIASITNYLLAMATFFAEST